MKYVYYIQINCSQLSISTSEFTNFNSADCNNGSVWVRTHKIIAHIWCFDPLTGITTYSYGLFKSYILVKIPQNRWVSYQYVI